MSFNIKAWSHYNNKLNMSFAEIKPTIKLFTSFFVLYLYFLLFTKNIMYTMLKLYVTSKLCMRLLVEIHTSFLYLIWECANHGNYYQYENSQITAIVKPFSDVGSEKIFNCIMRHTNNFLFSEAEFVRLTLDLLYI